MMILNGRILRVTCQFYHLRDKESALEHFSAGEEILKGNFLRGSPNRADKRNQQSSKTVICLSHKFPLLEAKMRSGGVLAIEQKWLGVTVINQFLTHSLVFCQETVNLSLKTILWMPSILVKFRFKIRPKTIALVYKSLILKSLQTHHSRNTHR